MRDVKCCLPFAFKHLYTRNLSICLSVCLSVYLSSICILRLDRTLSYMLELYEATAQSWDFTTLSKKSNFKLSWTVCQFLQMLLQIDHCLHNMHNRKVVVTLNFLFCNTNIKDKCNSLAIISQQWIISRLK